MPSAKNPYELLGVQEEASEREIRRAYRQKVVVTHRSGVLGLVDEIETLTQAYEALKDPSRRRSLDASRRAARERPWPSNWPGDGFGVRSRAAREVQWHSARIGAMARRENAETVRTLSAEYDQREAADRKARNRREQVRRVLRGLVLLLITVVAALAARRLGRY